MARRMSTPWSVTEHYENFPVGSLLMPAVQRAAIGALYRFARYADDVADEGEVAAAFRLSELRALDEAVKALGRGEPVAHPAVGPLAAHVREHGLPLRLLHDLLSAFEQDVTTARYASFAGLRDYCRRSADPVGRLVLRISKVDDPQSDLLSDRICTGLQLLNFVQDVASDWDRGRVYVPLDELHAAGLDELALGRAVMEARSGSATPTRLRALLGAQTARARALLESGAALPQRLPRRLGWEIRAILAAALRVCDRLGAARHDVLRTHVRLRATDAGPIAALAWRLRRAEHARAQLAARPDPRR